jgi:nucleotide-binding universal stress UspA family protein
MTLELRRLLALVRSEPADKSVLHAAREVLRCFNAEELTVLEVRSADAAIGPIESEVMLERDVPEPGELAPLETFILRIGDPVDAVATEAAVEGVDVLITAESQMLTQRLLRKVPCTVLVIPASDEERVGPVLAPVDGDAPRLATLQFAAMCALKTQRPLEILHIYSVPLGYHKMGRTYEDFAESMRRNAELKIEALVRQLRHPNLEITTRYVLVKMRASIAVAILREAQSRSYSQIVLGGRIRRRVAGILFPSISERVVLSSPSPVWVVRDRSEHSIGFLEAADVL